MKYYATSFLIAMLAVFASPNYLTDSPGSKGEPVSFIEQRALAEETTASKPDAKLLSQEFIHKLTPEVDDQYKVKGYSSKEELIRNLSHIASKKVASDYVNGMFEEKNGKLYIIPTDLPPWVEKDKPYELKKLSDTSYHLIQKNKSDLYGEYSITLGFEKVNSHWVITFASVT
ncbi:hypothetical protein LCY76_16325 [Fictibacillus sp. KIGAM418]|uniref:DUF3993 domain-containing protein n=1 Tax=Fictibacillus marinisediminis TaxID=2878389 RepID=A0A9X2BDR2_9BACL|nr:MULTISPECIES: hypothetical protein [Fictibacillus]MCK6258144.1 hypothetical protein [Fictibacillus marinisediminis]MED2971400.1 hypothetical protein [Fictibacillus sp. B-59209]